MLRKLYQIPRDKSPLAGDNSLNHQQAGTYKKLISIGKWYNHQRKQPGSLTGESDIAHVVPARWNGGTTIMKRFEVIP
jgi:hypothetical protein